MKTFLLSLAAVGAIAAAATPAAAQDWRGQGDVRDGLQWRIERAEQRGVLDRRDAWRLKVQLRETDRLGWRYRRDGVVDRWERNDLNRRYSQIGDDLRDAVRGDGPRYSYGYGDRNDDHDGYRGDERQDWRR